MFEHGLPLRVQSLVLLVTLLLLCMQNAAAKMMAGQRAVLGSERPDLRLLQVSIVRQMLETHDVRRA